RPDRPCPRRTCRLSAGRTGAASSASEVMEWLTPPSKRYVGVGGARRRFVLEALRCSHRGRRAAGSAALGPAHELDALGHDLGGRPLLSVLAFPVADLQ